jgi:isopenicillin N synthase-like dioxygenase
VTTGISELSNDMATTGVSFVETHEFAAVLHNLLAVARAFFEQPADQKIPTQPSPGQMTGWRAIGVEYSQSPDRPDLNETFCFRLGDAGDPSSDTPMRAACRAAQTGLDKIAAKVLADLQAEVATYRSPPVRTAKESWLQLNFSRPAAAGREFIQDAHEDGHLITLLFADERGLEVEPTNGWTDAFASPERLIVFGGECGALVTDDHIRPMMHRVRARADVASRLSVAYFVNPDLDQVLNPWRWGPRNRGVDLLRWGQENPVRFGLPKL